MSNDPPEFPLRDMLGMVIEQGEGRATASLVVDERHINPHGALHGAVPFTLIDTAMGAATMSIVDDGVWCTTVDIHTRFLAPCFGGTVTCSAEVRRAGHRIVHLDAVVVDSEGTEIAAASGVFALIAAAS
jgi:acyl-CoA thioesterase